MIAIHNSENDTATAIRGRRRRRGREREREREREIANHFSSVRPFDELQSAVSAPHRRPKDMESMSPFAASSQLHHTIDSMIEK